MWVRLVFLSFQWQRFTPHSPLALKRNVSAWNTRSCTLSHPHKGCDLSWQFHSGRAGSPCLQTSCFLKLRGGWGPLSIIKMLGINHKWSLHSGSALPILHSPLQRTTEWNTNKQMRVWDYFAFCWQTSFSAPWEELVKTAFLFTETTVSSEDFQCLCICVCHRNEDKLMYVHVSSLTHVCNQLVVLMKFPGSVHITCLKNSYTSNWWYREQWDDVTSKSTEVEDDLKLFKSSARLFLWGF